MTPSTAAMVLILYLPALMMMFSLEGPAGIYFTAAMDRTPSTTPVKQPVCS